LTTSNSHRAVQRPGPVVSQDLQRARGNKLWGKIGEEIGLPLGTGLSSELKNLPRPSYLAPRRLPIPGRAVRSRPGLNRSQKHEAGRRIISDGTGNLRVSLKASQRKSSEGPRPTQRDSRDPLLDIPVDLEVDDDLADLLGSLPLGPSSKLERRAQWLRARAPSPGLAEALRKAARDYDEKKKKDEEERFNPKPPRLLITPLPDEAVRSLPNLAKIPRSQEMSKFGRIPITPHDLLTLRPEQWLNDEILNSWFWELCDKAKTLLHSQMVAKGGPITDDTPRYHAFNTQWYPAMAKSDWASKVPRWAKRAKVDGANLLKVHKILIPIHQGVHWTLIVILPQRRIARYYDSLGGHDDRYITSAKHWVSHELGDLYKDDEWQFEIAESGQQINQSDCGVFTCINALATFYSDSTPEIVPTGHMIDARDFMRYILINRGFNNDYELAKLHPNFRLETDRSVGGASSKGKEKAK
jgi:hypothetical protein